MTVSRLRSELSESEFVHFAAFYENKGEEERREIEKAKRKR